MTPPLPTSGIRDNHHRGIVAEFLREKIHSGSRLSMVSAYFTIYAYEALKDSLDQIEHLDFLFGEPRFIASLDPDKTETKSFILDGNGLHLANKLQQKRVARECADWIRQKVDIRSVRHAQLLHGKMYHIANAGVEEAILGSSNFTVRGLGLAAGNNNIELNLEVDSTRDRRDLKTWFDELWYDPDLVADVKQEVLLYLDQLYQNQPPEFICFKTLFHVFENFLTDQEKGGLLDQNIKIVDTGIWLDDGTVRYTFVQPKQILEIYRLLCSGKAAACEQLCQLFDTGTNNGADMSLYNKLLKAAVDSIVRTFQKRVASGLQFNRDFVIPDQQDQARDTTDFELITWLVIKAPEAG